MSAVAGRRRRVRGSAQWQFFATLPKAAPGLAAAWWAVLVLRGVLPAVFAVAMGVLVGAVRSGAALTGPLTFMGVVFVLLQVLTPVHTGLSANLGDRTAAWLYDRLTDACVGPPGMGHLEDPDLAEDLQSARDFDLGTLGPPLFIAMDFIAAGLVELVGGIASVVVLAGFSVWAALLLGLAWASTHWLLRESGVWRDRNTAEVRAAQRQSDYAYRLAVDPPAAKELRLFGLVGWTLERFVEQRTHLHELQYRATRLREQPLAVSGLVVVAANVVVFVWLARSATGGGTTLGEAVTYAQVAVGTSMIAFGGLNWALDGAAPPVAATLRLAAATDEAGALDPPPSGAPRPADGMPAAQIRFRDVRFAYPGGSPVLDGFDLTVPAGRSLAIVGRNGAGKTTLAKLLCRLYDPTSGAVEVDGVDLRDLDVAAWRRRVAAVFQDYVRFELPLRDNVVPAGGAPDDVVLAALADAGADDLAALDTPLAKGYEGGTDLSGGQWQRVALARALAGVRLGAGVVLLDEPTAQLDVRGEAEIFRRILEATRGTTTILVSHRFSTVRLADLICVVEGGRVVELGSHDELMALRGRYREMFDLQAQRFGESEEDEEVAYDVL